MYYQFCMTYNILIGSSSSLDDEAMQTIEGTFKQFNAFLDLLNEKG